MVDCTTECNLAMEGAAASVMLPAPDLHTPGSCGTGLTPAGLSRIYRRFVAAADGFAAGFAAGLAAGFVTGVRDRTDDLAPPFAGAGGGAVTRW